MYRGRFAPTPSGPLNFGSIITSLGSYLQAKNQNGEWLVHIEDNDIPCNQFGAINCFLKSLEQLSLHWDREILYQSKRDHIYHEILDNLNEQGATYPCICPRSKT